MTDDNRVSTTNLIEMIIEDFKNSSLSYINPSLPILEGFIVKQPIRKSKDEFCYVFVSLDYRHSIKCIFKSISEDIVHQTNYQIAINKYYFDFIVRSNESKELEFKTILSIQSYSFNNAVNLIENQKMLSINMNKEETIKEISINLYNQLIRKVINQYTSAFPLNDFSAKQFIQKSFDVSSSIIRPTLFEMIKKVYQISNDCDGILLRQRKGIDYTFKYFVDKDQETIEILTTNINWKELMITTNTIKEKQREIQDPFFPTPVLLKEFTNQVIINEKKTFLQNKIQRDNTSEEEKQLLSKSVNELITDYGDINVNIGNSLVEKYLLYQRYTEFAKQDDIGIIKK